MCFPKHACQSPEKVAVPSLSLCTGSEDMWCCGCSVEQGCIVGTALKLDRKERLSTSALQSLTEQKSFALSGINLAIPDPQALHILP